MPTIVQIQTKDQTNENISEKKPQKEPSLFKKFFAELLGTTILIFSCCGGPIYNNNEIIPSAVSGSFIITVLTYLLGKISGAQFNSSVSVAMFIRGYLTAIELLVYTAAQIIGAFLGCIFIAVCRKGNFKELAGTKIHANLLGTDGKISPWCYISAFYCEMFLTFILVMMAFATNYHKKTELENLSGIITGLTLFVIIIIGFNISGSSFNPARSLAPAILQIIAGGDNEPLKEVWIYIFAPILGGIIASATSYFLYN